MPSLKNTELLFFDSDYVELAPQTKPLLTLIPPATFGPPEKVWVDKVETDKPGMLLADYGLGKIAYIPWDIGGLYYRHSSVGHAGLVADLVDSLLPSGRQLKTDAHPLVEITVMKQPQAARTLVHLVNLSGHSDTAYFPPIAMPEITVELADEFKSARSTALARDLRVTRQGRSGRFVLPRLGSYDVVVLQ